MRLRNFSVGKTLLMPSSEGPDSRGRCRHGMFFFHTEHYYAATLAEIEAAE